MPVIIIFRSFPNFNTFSCNLYSVNRKVYDTEYKTRHVCFSSNRSSFRPSLTKLFSCFVAAFHPLLYLRPFLVNACLLYSSFSQSSNLLIETSGVSICHYTFFYTLLFSRLFYVSHLSHFHLQISIKNTFSITADSSRDVNT